jgi:histidyl-tRNA synthetase
MHDILPADMPVWNLLEGEYRALVETYGYREIRTPIVERTALFARSIGEVTDIVEKEMYSFDDRNGDSLSLRPENTASVVRAGLQAGLLHDQQQRLWYYGPMFRYERPQKGRYRQFHQFGAEIFGIAGADIEAELILLAARFWKRLGLEHIDLQINSLGSSESRKRFRDLLVEYFRDHLVELDDDSKRRLESNPLRILDSKNPDMQTLIEAAPALRESLDTQSRDHFAELTDILDQTGVGYEVNQRLVRGLDYYSHTVFEWVTESLGAQGTVCGGGRYDGLVEQLGGKANHAAGFSMGCERLVSMLIDQQLAPAEAGCDAYLMMRGDGSVARAQQLAESMRDELPRLQLVVHAGAGSFKSQMRKADKSGAKIAIIIGESEMAAGTVAVKFLRQQREQVEISQTKIVTQLASLLQ